MKHKERKSDSGRFRFIDFLIVVLCLLIMACGIKLFRDDLYQTIRLQNVQPVGTITIKNNTVQRRIADRVLWDRLVVESPVYLGDIIRVAELSAATLNIEDQHIDIEENTLIRIQLAPDGSGALQIELTEGTLGVTTGAESGGLQLNLMGRVIETGAGTALTAAAGKDGIALQVNEGKAVFIEEGANREIVSGTMIALDAEGTEQRAPSAVVTLPRPNARYVKSGEQSLPVAFAWNRVNLQPQDTLRLEIAPDRNFSRIVQSVQNLSSSAEVFLEAGLWNWRLSHENTVLSSGRLTVVEASNLSLLSPVRGSLFRYQDEQPLLRFQWSEIEEASHYIIEIASTPDFTNPRINKQIAAPFFVDSTLAEGTWYWRIMPVFSDLYEGRSSFSAVSSFRIEQDSVAEGFALELPEPELPAPMVTLRLVSPAPGASLPGLTALRQQTQFRWETDSEAAHTRFVLSRSADPLATPVVEILNPDRTINLDRLEQGVWYWTVEARTADGVRLAAAEPRQLQVLAIPLLPAPERRSPANGYRIGIEQIKTQRNIVFRWSAVTGANAYIFTLYEQTSSGRRRIVLTQSPTRTEWTLENIGDLERGSYVWQVEAVNRQGSAIEQRGRTAENTFVIDVPRPGTIELERPGILYGE